jgi:hypothetical protein
MNIRMVEEASVKEHILKMNVAFEEAEVLGANIDLRAK